MWAVPLSDGEAKCGTPVQIVRAGKEFDRCDLRD